MDLITWSSIVNGANGEEAVEDNKQEELYAVWKSYSECVEMS